MCLIVRVCDLIILTSHIQEFPIPTQMDSCPIKTSYASCQKTRADGESIENDMEEDLCVCVCFTKCPLNRNLFTHDISVLLLRGTLACMYVCYMMLSVCIHTNSLHKDTTQAQPASMCMSSVTTREYCSINLRHYNLQLHFQIITHPSCVSHTYARKI